MIIVVVHSALAEADDGKSALTDHGFFLQHETFDRLVKGLGTDRVRFYEMNRRYVHSKLILADDRWWCIGSANVNPRGFGLDSELNVQFREPTPDVLTGFRKRLWRTISVFLKQRSVLGAPRTSLLYGTKWRPPMPGK